MFKQYDAGGARSWEPIVSAYPRGQFSFSRGAIRQMQLKEGDAVVLFFDDEENLIGIRKAKTDDNGSVKLSFRQDGSSALASAKGFFSYFDILPKETVQFIPEHMEDMGLYVLKPRKK